MKIFVRVECKELPLPHQLVSEWCAVLSWSDDYGLMPTVCEWSERHKFVGLPDEHGTVETAAFDEWQLWQYINQHYDGDLQDFASACAGPGVLEAVSWHIVPAV
jgi:hypothetical protein